MRSLQLKNWVTRFQQWVIYGLIALIITTSIAVFGIITYTNDSTKANSKRFFESTLWNALQLQLQSYRFLNYLSSLNKSDFPLNGKAFFQYDLLMSRVDLLKDGSIGMLIQRFSGGKAARLLNIINGELKLISLNLSKLEKGNISSLADLINRIQNLDKPINELVILINHGSQQYIAKQHKSLQTNLDRIQILTIFLLISLLFLCFFMIKGLAKSQHIFKKNHHLSNKISSVLEDKLDTVLFINQEVKNTTNAIISSVNTLKKQDTSATFNGLANNIKESGQQLLSTMNMFSDLAQIDAKKLTLAPTTDNLTKVIEDYLFALAPQLERKNLQFIAYIDPSLPDAIYMDFPRLQTIIAALVQNAIANTPNGSISLQIRPSILPPSSKIPPQNKQQMIQIAIRDTGIGMDSNIQQHLRSHTTTQAIPLQSEVGLALALCHKLVVLLKGKIHFSCAQQKGCEFWVDLPYQNAVSNHTQQAMFSYPSKTKEALLIESDQHLATVLSLQLAALNIAVTHSIDGVYQAANSYDLIILGDTHLVDNEALLAFQHSHEAGLPCICYNQTSYNHTLPNVFRLSQPLIQSHLEKIIFQLFGEAKNNSLSDKRKRP